MIRINLLKTEKKEEIKETAVVSTTGKKPRIKLTFNYNLLLLLLVVIIAALFINLRSQLKNENALLESAKQEKVKLKDVAATLTRLEQQKKLYERKINLIKQLESKQGSAVNVMDEMSRSLPEWVWLTEANFKNRIVRLTGKAINNNLIADYISNLENSPHFNAVNLVSSTLKNVRNNRFFEFTLTARYVIPPPPQIIEGNKEEEAK
jgi:Tfp pilus assembly protein PilN